MKCFDYGSDALNKTYGGMDCQTHPAELPFTGSEIGLYVLLGLMLVIAGIILHKTNKETS